MMASSSDFRGRGVHRSVFEPAMVATTLAVSGAASPSPRKTINFSSIKAVSVGLRNLKSPEIIPQKQVTSPVESSRSELIEAGTGFNEFIRLGLKPPPVIETMFNPPLSDACALSPPAVAGTTFKLLSRGTESRGESLPIGVLSPPHMIEMLRSRGKLDSASVLLSPSKPSLAPVTSPKLAATADEAVRSTTFLQTSSLNKGMKAEPVSRVPVYVSEARELLLNWNKSELSEDEIFYMMEHLRAVGTTLAQQYPELLHEIECKIDVLSDIHANHLIRIALLRLSEFIKGHFTMELSTERLYVSMRRQFLSVSKQTSFIPIQPHPVVIAWLRSLNSFNQSAHSDTAELCGGTLAESFEQQMDRPREPQQQHKAVESPVYVQPRRREIRYSRETLLELQFNAAVSCAKSPLHNRDILWHYNVEFLPQIFLNSPYYLPSDYRSAYNPGM